jgi:hypothetical protein
VAGGGRRGDRRGGAGGGEGGSCLSWRGARSSSY